MKKVLSILLVVAMLFAFAACGGDTATTTTTTTTTGTTTTETTGYNVETPIELSMSMTATPTSVMYPTWLKFQEVLEETLPGYFEVVTYDSGVMGGERDQANGMILGTTSGYQGSDAAIQAIDEWAGAEMGNVPFMIQDPHNWEILLTGEFGEMLMEAYHERGVYPTGFMTGDRVVVGNKVRRLATPSDIKGLKIRVWEADGPFTFMNAVGGEPTVMSITEVYTGLQQGAIDGAITSCFQFNDNKWTEILKYITDSGVMCNWFSWLFSEDYMNSLEPVAQEALYTAGKAAQDFCFDSQLDTGMAQTRQTFADLDVECYVPTDAETEEWLEASMTTWDFWCDYMGEELFMSAVNGLGYDWTPSAN